MNALSISLPPEVWDYILPFCNDPELLAVRATCATLHRLVHPLLLAKTKEPIDDSWDLTWPENSMPNYCQVACRVTVQPPPSQESAKKNMDTFLQNSYKRFLVQARDHRRQVSVSFDEFKNQLEENNNFEWTMNEYRGDTHQRSFRLKKMTGTVEEWRQLLDECDSILPPYDSAFENDFFSAAMRQLACCIRYRTFQRDLQQQHEHMEASTPTIPVEYLVDSFHYHIDENWGEQVTFRASFSAVNLSNGEQLDYLMTVYEETWM